MVVEDQQQVVDAVPTGARPSARGRNVASLWVHFLSIAWLVAMAVAVLGPALSRGSSFGSYDWLSGFGLLQQHGVVPHSTVAGDQVDAIIPWSNLAWTQVHHGQLPLWNPYAALGMPLAFNWQSAAFSVPALIGYLFPLHLAFTVEVVATLVIAGTGMYVLGRVLGLHAIVCVFAATVFELSGPMVGSLGWPECGVIAWMGWLLAAGLLVVRGTHRVRDVAFFAFVMAAMVYGGQPEVLVLSALAAITFLAVMLLSRHRPSDGSESLRRPTVDLLIAGVAGAALSAPLWLPGIQVISLSHRGTYGGGQALGVHDLFHLFTQGFEGLPIAGSQYFGEYMAYVETAAYVGAITVVLAVVAVALRWRRPEVRAGVSMAVAMAIIAFVPPVVTFLDGLPFIGTVQWHRGIIFIVFAVVVLGGIGADTVVRSSDTRAVRWCLGIGFAAVGLLAVVWWALSRAHLSPAQASIRDRSFIWPAVDVVVGLAVVGGLILLHRRGRLHGFERRMSARAGQLAVTIFLVCETAFLVAAGAPLWTASSTPYAPTAAVTSLQKSVGSATVGLGRSAKGGCLVPPTLGILQNVQLVYGIHEVAVYDPVVPSEYYSAWRALTRRLPNNFLGYSVYCPPFTTAREARVYGVGFVLVFAHARGPTGGVFVRHVGDEDLYRIPGAAPATLTAESGNRRPPIDAPGTPVGVSHPDAATWRMVTHSETPGVLRLRVTNVPGWQASIDGRPLAMRTFAGIMLQANVPAGTHTVEIHYWPKRFTVALVLAGLVVVGFAAAGAVALVSRRRRAPTSPALRGTVPAEPVETGPR